VKSSIYTEAEMSKNETPMIKKYWEKIGGTLIEEFQAVKRSPTCAQRLLDGVIILRGEKRIARRREVSLKGKDVIVIQAKARRLSMTLMGQTLFSAELIKKHEPKSVLSVALCTEDDSELRRLLKQYPNIQVEVMPEFSRPRRRRRRE
jgi:hypothetical protein